MVDWNDLDDDIDRLKGEKADMRKVPPEKRTNEQNDALQAIQDQIINLTKQRKEARGYVKLAEDSFKLAKKKIEYYEGSEQFSEQRPWKELITQSTEVVEEAQNYLNEEKKRASKALEVAAGVEKDRVVASRLHAELNIPERTQTQAVGDKGGDKPGVS